MKTDEVTRNIKIALARSNPERQALGFFLRALEIAGFKCFRPVSRLVGLTTMSHGGPPYWVGKQNESLLRASHESENAEYARKINDLKKENDTLKKHVEELQTRIAHLEDELKRLREETR